MPHQHRCTVGPYAYGRVAGNDTKLLSKTGEQHEMEVDRFRIFRLLYFDNVRSTLPKVSKWCNVDF